MKRSAPPKTSRVAGATPGRISRADKYAQVFEPKKRRGLPPVEIEGDDEDASELVERMVAAVTAAVRQRYTGPLVDVGARPTPETAEDGSGPGQPSPAMRFRCGLCDNTDEPHYHGATLYQAGKEVF